MLTNPQNTDFPIEINKIISLYTWENILNPKKYFSNISRRLKKTPDLPYNQIWRAYTWLDWNSLYFNFRFSIWLNHNSWTTMDSLMNGFEKCYKPNPSRIQTKQVFNYSEWIMPYLAPMIGHSRHHVYKYLSWKMAKQKWFLKNGQLQK